MRPSQFLSGLGLFVLLAAPAMANPGNVPNFVFQTSFGGLGSAPGQFNVPSGVVITANGNLAVTDFFNNRVQIFNSKLKYLRSYDGTTCAPHFAGPCLQFNGPFNVTLDKHGNFWIPDEDDTGSAGTIREFNPKGQQIAMIDGTLPGGPSAHFVAPAAAVFDKNGNLVVGDFNPPLQADAIRIFNPKTGEQLANFSGPLYGVTGLSVDLVKGSPHYGEIYAVSQFANERNSATAQVAVFDSAGNYLRKFGLPAPLTSAGFENVLVTPQELVLVADGSEGPNPPTFGVHVFDIDGNLLTTLYSPAGSINVAGLYATPAGKILFTTTSNFNQDNSEIEEKVEIWRQTDDLCMPWTSASCHQIGR